MSQVFLSRFTPSLMSPETLEHLSVGRQKEVERVLTLLRQSITTHAKHHSLFVGPRGIGKTHTLSLIYHRLLAEPDLRDKIVVAWLREEEWGVSSYLDFAIRVLRSISIGSESKRLGSDIEKLYDLSASEAERHAENLLKREIAGKTLILFMENLDVIFHGMGEVGQQKLRSFMQENALISIVATTQSLFAGVSSQTKPFYGFFNLYHLSPLSFEEAVGVLTKIAKLKSDEQLIAYLQTPEGRSRVRAVHHLIGGNPRLYIVFSEFLTHSSLSNLVIPFMRMLDDLTPYYQDRMRWLSQQQRQIIEILSDAGKPVSVKEIAKRAFITQQTTSSQLKQLRELGYVVSKQKGRESLYELMEPLMRLAVEVKKNRGEPIRLLIDFLRFWYSPDDLENRLQLLGSQTSIEHDYLKIALKEVSENEHEPRTAACIRDYYNLIDQGDFAAASEVADELLSISNSVSHWFRKWACANSQGLKLMADEAATKVMTLEPRDAFDWLFRATFLAHAGRTDESVPAYRKACDLKPNLRDAWSGLTLALIKLGNFVEALEANHSAIALEPESNDDWHYRGYIYTEVKNFEEARAAYNKVTELAPGEYASWLNLGWMYCSFGNYQEALHPLEKAMNLNRNITDVWVNRGWALAGLGRHREAIKNFDRALELTPEHAMALNNRGFSLIELDMFKEALSTFTTYSRLYPDNPRAWQGLAQVHYHLDDYERSLHAAERALQLNNKSAITWSIVGVDQSYLRRFTDAIKSLDKALHLGDHSGLTVFHRAVSSFALRDEETGLSELNHAVQHSCPTHGPDLKSMSHLLSVLFRETPESNWVKSIAGLIEIYRRHGLSAKLGVVLVRSLSHLSADAETQARLERWVHSWRKALHDREEYKIANDLLTISLQYARTGDENLLTSLPLEEKHLVQELPKMEFIGEVTR